MGILFMATADMGDREVFDSGNSTVSTDYARTGTRSFYLYGNVTSETFTFSDTTAGYIRVCIRGGTFNIDLKEEGTTHLRINTTAISWVLYRSTSTVLDSGAVAQSNSGFRVVEVYWDIHDTTGTCTIKIDGVTAADFSGDTRNGGTSGLVNTVTLRTSGTTTVAYIDDIIVRDDEWPERGGLHVLTPNAGSSNENWTASAGNPEDCVDDVPVSFADYIYTDGTVTGTEHLVGLTTLTADSADIPAVGVFVKAQISESGTINCRTMLKAGTTTEVGSSVAMSTAANWFASYYDVNPDDSAAWENTDIDALEVGVETI